MSLLADYLFRSCLPHLDVTGRMTGNPELIKAAVAPLRDEIHSGNLPELLRELAAAKDHNGIPLVFWYEIGGAKVLEFPAFAKHQTGLRADREAPSKFPPRNGMEKVLHLAGPTPDLLPQNHGVGTAQDEVEVEGEDEDEGEQRAVVAAGPRENGDAVLDTDETTCLASAAQALAIAANRGLADHPTKPQRIPHIMPGAGRTYQATEEILGAGAELEFAIAEVYSIAKSHDADGEITSLRYFVAPVIRAWNQHEATNAGEDWIPPTGVRGRPDVSQRANAKGGNRYDAVFAEYLRKHGTE